MRYWRALVMNCCLVMSCGTAHPGMPSELDLTRVEGLRAQAPAEVAAAERAAQDAATAARQERDDAAQDHATEARLWIESAEVVAELEGLRARRDALAEEAEEWVARSAQAAAARVAREREASRQEAVEIARHEMTLAYEQAAIDEARRQRRRSATMDAARVQAAAAFAARARQLVLAARAMGASEADAAAIEAQLAEGAPAQPSAPIERLRAARQAFEEALSLLGSRRAALPLGPEVHASLIEAARLASLEVSELREGVAIALRADAVAPLADLIRGFPHGIVLLRGPQGAATRRRLIQAGVEEARLQLAGEGEESLAIFTAYALP